ncbi:ureidoglycolate hydrolase [Lipomyces tetrasporus]|uniref:Ureidoglycolate lyase n=1 Tax=Lipomyces tetrasporus TaxID=54092 RepID=A0AAD7VRP3_9ASCO|nr:ureidoglycolate hydrolase [Lipomyces tetrasporus]KAJ8098335.1 ureidoglycolate hydrolase [Lipomyces tetrasporus]
MPLATFNLPASLEPVEASSLTPEGFAKFGGVISSVHQLQTMTPSPANYGTATKISKVSPIVNNFQNAPSQIPSTANFNLFRSTYPFKLIQRNGYDGVYLCGVLERHPYSTQAFLPMGIPANDVAYLLIVAENAPGGLPDLKTLRAFVANGNQAVTYGPGTWHAPMVSLKEVIDFAVLIHENGVADEDCQEVYINPRVPVLFRSATSSTVKALL